MYRFLFSIVMTMALATITHAEDVSVAASAKETKPLQSGDAMPDVSVLDAEGNPVQLRSLYANGPVVIVFFRGSWCPICTKHFQDLIKAHTDISALGATMIAISPDTTERTQENAAKLKSPFPLYSDSDVAAAKAFGLAFKVDGGTIAKYKGFGIDLEEASGRTHQVLPVPALYIADKSGKIVFAYSNPDYTKRIDMKTLLKELKAIR